MENFLKPNIVEQTIEAFLKQLSVVNQVINDFIWGPIMLVLLIGTGVYLSLRLGFPQFRQFAYVMKRTVGTLLKKQTATNNANEVTPFQAVATAMASTVGTGSITGIATAIVSGGPGAIFWMWISALVGMVTKYAEIILAVHFRRQNEAGQNIGGPMYYLEYGLHAKWLAVIFSFLTAIACFGIGNMTQAHSIATALDTTFHVNRTVTGIILMIVVGAVILGGIRRIVVVNEKIVPFMAVFYVTCAVITLIANYRAVPNALALIFREAFNFQAAAGGTLGYGIMLAMRYGFARGVFSNEAGLGSAPIAHAASNTKDPVEQGLWGMFEVFFTSIVICTLSALVILTSGLWQGTTLEGAELSIAAFNQSLPFIGGIGVTIATVLFATSTIFGWAYYGEKSIEYLFPNSKTAILIYRIIYVLVVIIGSKGSLTLIWDISDTMNGMMAIPNLIGILGLSGVVIKLTKEHFATIKK